MKIFSSRPSFLSRVALAILGLIAGLLAGAPGAAAAEETFAYPAKNPLIQGKLPAGWKMSVTTDGYIVLLPPNAEDSRVYLEIDQTGVADPKAGMEKRAREAAAAVYSGMHGTQFQDGGTTKTANGIILYSVTLRGKDGWDDDQVITITRITPAGGKSLILSFSGPPATAKAQAKDLAALVDSCKPAR